eukprot:CAMPEP_0202110212 /NCGR_PEP_ID=MMETSP0965-20130614/26025_1 /ASSEMBLY_ACC=CAM_ASM_000507 /TAXON_ID=4773 /ORGANISM="Schizochytrium aggregatum, Strain ATCC28209" /LENGTH=391 /DNA_ID=CAMNT_0048679615 /DNA_START=431 /DNA_END=1606 /DNA_ORIENTATION=+
MKESWVNRHHLVLEKTRREIGRTDVRALQVGALARLWHDELMTVELGAGDHTDDLVGSVDNGEVPEAQVAKELVNTSHEHRMMHCDRTCIEVRPQIDNAVEVLGAEAIANVINARAARVVLVKVPPVNPRIVLLHLLCKSLGLVDEDALVEEDQQLAAQNGPLKHTKALHLVRVLLPKVSQVFLVSRSRRGAQDVVASQAVLRKALRPLQLVLAALDRLEGKQGPAVQTPVRGLGSLQRARARQREIRHDREAIVRAMAQGVDDVAGALEHVEDHWVPRHVVADLRFVGVLRRSVVDKLDALQLNVHVVEALGKLVANDLGSHDGHHDRDGVSGVVCRLDEDDDDGDGHAGDAAQHRRRAEQRIGPRVNIAEKVRVGGHLPHELTHDPTHR